ncbi:MAG TPA: hypothetical protein VK914_02805 [bacterium]|jgi:hypothetical protein|nr:hypothetical protein [bacterium]
MPSFASLILPALSLFLPAACFADSNAALQHDTAEALSQGIVNNNSQELGVGLMGLGAMAVLDAANAPAPRPAGPSPAQMAEIRRQQRLAMAAQQLNSKGLAYLNAGKYGMAIFEFQMALAKTPGDAGIANNLAMAKQQRAFEAEKREALGDLKGAPGASAPDGGLKDDAASDSALKDDSQPAAKPRESTEKPQERAQEASASTDSGANDDLQLK